MAIAAEKDPQHLAIVAALAGVAPPDVRRARVVDIACGDGEGLVASALALPDATFVGFDASSSQIDAARALAHAVGARNLTFVVGAPDAAESIADGCDVILADGVWSSFDDAERARLLAWVARTLSPCGLVFLSFDALPGARMLDVVRETLAHLSPDAPTRRELATGLVAHFERPTKDAADPAYTGMLRTKSEQLSALLVASPTAGALLDELSTNATRASYFGDVAARAADAGLTWIAEARTHDILDEPLEPAAATLADSAANGDLIAREEYADYFRGRTFRRSIFTRHRDAERAPDARASTVHVTVRARVAEDGSLVTLQNAPIAIGAEARALVDELAPFAPETRAVDRARLMPDGAARRSMADAIGSGVLRAFVAAPRVCGAVSERPRAHPIARVRARSGAAVFNPYGERVALDAIGASLLAELDGTRDRTALVDVLERIGVAAGILPPHGADRARVAAGADAMLAAFAASALLEA